MREIQAGPVESTQGEIPSNNWRELSPSPCSMFPVIGMRIAASVIGGFGTPIGLVILVLLARDHTVMGAQLISGRLAIAGWTVAVIVGGCGLLFVIGAALGDF